MKLIEKLAREFTEADKHARSIFDIDLQKRAAYHAGFYEARDMAAAIEYRGSQNSEQWHELMKLGEEEV